MDTRRVAVEFVGPERAVERARFQVRGRADFHHRPEVPPEAHTHRLPQNLTVHPFSTFVDGYQSTGRHLIWNARPLLFARDSDDSIWVELALSLTILWHAVGHAWSTIRATI